MPTHRHVSRVASVLVGVLLAVSTATAELPEVVFEITAQAGSDVITLPIEYSEGVYNFAEETWSWELQEPLDLMAGDVYLGTLSELTASVKEDPVVNLNFAIQAGPENLQFSVASQVLTFDPIADAYAQASASFALTDNNFDGATLVGIGDQGGAYLAQYNGWAGNPFGPDGTTFAEGVFAMQSDFGTVTDDFNYPETGMEPISEIVDSMSALVSFQLTAQDQVSGTSSFTIVPEPAVLGGLAFGALMLLRRRR